MALLPEVVYLSSPSSHAVPCSPHISQTLRSPILVPDIDQHAGITTLTNYENRTPQLMSRPHTSSYPASPVTSTLRNPLHQLAAHRWPSNTNVNLQCPSSASLSQASEQVVPNCSPCSSQESQELDEKENNVGHFSQHLRSSRYSHIKCSQPSEQSPQQKQGQQQAQEQELEQKNQHENGQGCSSGLVLDEKAPSSRRNRCLTPSVGKQAEGAKFLFQEDNIFD